MKWQNVTTHWSVRVIQTNDCSIRVLSKPEYLFTNTITSNH